MTYQFFPSNRWDLSAVKQTYRDFFQRGLTFWTEQNYDIPLQTTFPVLVALLVLESLIQGVLSNRHDFVGIFLGQIGGVFGVSLLFGFILLMKEWLEARGDFKQYLAFLTYTEFVFLPIALISGLSANLGRFIGLIGALWVIFAFYRTFKLVWSRFLILVAIVWGIAFLAFLSTFFAGLKFLI